MRPYVLALMILSVLAGCPVSEQTTATATVPPEGDLGECTLDSPEGSAGSTTETPAPTTPAVRTTPVVPTATPSVTTTATPTVNSTR